MTLLLLIIATTIAAAVILIACDVLNECLLRRRTQRDAMQRLEALNRAAAKARFESGGGFWKER